jgi:hypothetical protein
MAERRRSSRRISRPSENNKRSCDGAKRKRNAESPMKRLELRKRRDSRPRRPSVRKSKKR